MEIMLYHFTVQNLAIIVFFILFFVSITFLLFFFLDKFVQYLLVCIKLQKKRFRNPTYGTIDKTIYNETNTNMKWKQTKNDEIKCKMHTTSIKLMQQKPRIQWSNDKKAKDHRKKRNNKCKCTQKHNSANKKTKTTYRNEITTQSHRQNNNKIKIKLSEKEIKQQSPKQKKLLAITNKQTTKRVNPREATLLFNCN